LNIFGFDINAIEVFLILGFVAGLALLIDALASNDKKQRKHK
jgi:hypothetical protein